jgi:hypothetical protein
MRRSISCPYNLGGQLDGKKSLGRPKHKWGDDINMGIKAVVCGLE